MDTYVDKPKYPQANGNNIQTLV